VAKLDTLDNAPDVVAALRSDDPFRIVTAAEMAVTLEEADLSEIVVTVYDKFWHPIGEAGDRISLNASKPRNQVPTVELVLKGGPVANGGDPLAKYLRKCRHEVVGITVEVGNLMWACIVDTASYKLNNRQRTVTAKCFGIFEILSYLLVWPNFLLPIQVQIPSHAVFIGPICSVIEIMIAEQALRIQSGLWELVNNAASLNPDLRAWFGTWLISNGDIFDMLTTPIYVVHHNPLFDPSPFIEGNFRMDTVAAAVDKLVKAYGVTIDVELWRPGDPPPDEWFPHASRTSAVYVVRVNDRSGITGPTGTFLDGILFQVVNLQGSVLGGVLDPLLNPAGQYSPEGVYIAPALGLNFMKPWPVLIDHPNGPMESFEIVDHHPQGWQLVIGGKSPKWMNDLINATLSWVLDSIMIIIGFTGVPSNLLDGFLNDAFLAFQLIENFTRRVDMGPYATRIEKFQATGAAPYNIDALFTFISLSWDTRGYRTAMASFRNGLPFWLGRDIFVGALMSIIDDEGAMLTEYIENVLLTQNRQQRAQVMVQLGDGKAEEAPIVKSQRLITGLQEAFNVLTLAPN
jgi:hypothetical protein